MSLVTNLHSNILTWHKSAVHFSTSSHLLHVPKSSSRSKKGTHLCTTWAIKHSLSHCMEKYTYVLYQEPMSRPKAARSVQLRATAFDFERFRHLPYMDISSSGESPFVVATLTCETSATYCVSMRTERVLLFRANSCIVNITRGPRIQDGVRARR